MVTTAHVLLDITSLRTDDHVSIMMSVLLVIMSARELKSASTLWAAIIASLQPTVCLSQSTDGSLLCHDSIPECNIRLLLSECHWKFQNAALYCGKLGNNLRSFTACIWLMIHVIWVHSYGFTKYNVRSVPSLTWPPSVISSRVSKSVNHF